MNKIVQTLRKGMVQASAEGTFETDIVPAGQDIAVEVPIGTSKLLLKSIDVIADKELSFIVLMTERPAGGNIVYDSGFATGRNYDVLDMVYQDTMYEEKCYLQISNKSEFEMRFSIKIRGIVIK